MTGNIPTETGLMSSLGFLWLSKNQLSGKIPKDIAQMASIQELSIDNNKLTGTLPDIFSNLTELYLVYANNNELTGEIPSSIWNMEAIMYLRLDDNNLNGIVPDDLCNKMSELDLDDSIYFTDNPHVECDCCVKSCRLWDPIWNPKSGDVKCPEENQVNLLDDYDIIPNSVIEFFTNETIYPEYGFCRSPTGCYVIEGEDRKDRHKVKKWFFGYSGAKNSVVMNDLSNPVCDPVELCGEIIYSNDPRRNVVDYFTQIGLIDLDLLYDTESIEHDIFCWMIGDGGIDSPMYHLDACDGTLLQFYTISLLFKTTNYENPIDLFSSSKDICNLNVIECDENQRFIEELNLHDKNLTGTLISEIWLLQSLKKIDLGRNKLKGTIPASESMNNLLHLKSIDLGHNLFEGTVPKKLLSHPSLRELNISNNKFVGSLPSKLSYPLTLGKHL